VLLVHGTPGGFGQVLPLAERLAEEGLDSIVFSRPGYLGTPLSVGRTFAEQADAAMALLDCLRIDTAAVVGISGGGPVALQIALRHPQRTTGLAMIAAVTFEEPGVAAAVAANPPGWRADLTSLAASFLPDLALRLCGVADPRERSRRAADPRLRSRLRTLFRSLAVSGLTNAGYQNDYRQAGADNPADYAIERIQAPTLAIYGDLDSVVPAAHGERLTQKIADARLVVMPGRHAFFILDEGAMLERLVPFLRKVARRSRASTPRR
jgi:pimeloyl-ACP methyl ester carboxylesterase